MHAWFLELCWTFHYITANVGHNGGDGELLNTGWWLSWFYNCICVYAVISLSSLPLLLLYLFWVNSVKCFYFPAFNGIKDLCFSFASPGPLLGGSVCNKESHQSLRETGDLRAQGEMSSADSYDLSVMWHASLSTFPRHRSPTAIFSVSGLFKDMDNLGTSWSNPGCP